MLNSWIVRGSQFKVRGGLADKWGRFKHFNILSMDKSNGYTAATRTDPCRETLRETQGACPCSVPQKEPRDQEKAKSSAAAQCGYSGLKNIFE